jgi:hypothetical protein
MFYIFAAQNILSSFRDVAPLWRLSVSYPRTLQPLKKVTLQLLLWGTDFASSFSYTSPRHHHGQEVVPVSVKIYLTCPSSSTQSLDKSGRGVGLC